MPSTWCGDDPGESWLWGDYVLILQKRPVTIAQRISEITKTKAAIPNLLLYPYAMSVFSKSGSYKKPVIVATLEQLIPLTAEWTHESEMPVVKGLFTASLRYNLGHFDQTLTPDSAREGLFEVVQKHLSLHGRPTRIGSMSDVFGNPSTGWPSIKLNQTSVTRQPKRKDGHRIMVWIIILLSIIALFALFRM